MKHLIQQIFHHNNQLLTQEKIQRHIPYQSVDVQWIQQQYLQQIQHYHDLQEIFNKTNITVSYLKKPIDLGNINDIAIALFSVVNGLYKTDRNDRYKAGKDGAAIYNSIWRY